MKALIMAGGKATRLYPMTLFMPKQLIMINGYPVIYYVINHCKKNGVNDIVLCISRNMKRAFSNTLRGDTSKGVKIRYSVAPQSIKTAGRILHAKEFIDNENFIIYYGDIITDFNLRSMIEFHKNNVQHNKCICTLAMSGSVPVEVGVGVEDKDGLRIACFKEKPKISDISNFKVNVGITVCTPRILNYCTEDADFFGDVIPHMIDRGESVCCYTIDRPFYDIGTFSAIEKVSEVVQHWKLFK